MGARIRKEESLGAVSLGQGEARVLWEHGSCSNDPRMAPTARPAAEGGPCYCGFGDDPRSAG